MTHRTIFHIDMDAFFAAVEVRDDPRLAGKPLVIGSDPKEGRGRGVVATCSYEARAFGIHSAQPISTAYAKCPQAVFMRPSFGKYSAASREVRRILFDFTPDVEPISIDEAFLDMTGNIHFYGSARKAGAALKDTIYGETELRASVGIAPVKMVAKIASDHCKPDGLLEITPDKMLEFLHPLAVKKLWGVGPKTQEALTSMGINTVGDIARAPLERLVQEMGQHGRHLHDLANGIDPRPVEASDEVKSVSNEHTFDEDVSDPDLMRRTLLRLSEKVSFRLRAHDLKGRTVSIKIRLKGFNTYTRALTLDKHVDLIDPIYGNAKKLFEEFYKPSQQVRLLGVRVANFGQAYVKDSLFEDTTEQRAEQVQQAMEKIREKFGDDTIHRGI